MVSPIPAPVGGRVVAAVGWRVERTHGQPDSRSPGSVLGLSCAPGEGGTIHLRFMSYCEARNADAGDFSPPAQASFAARLHQLVVKSDTQSVFFRFQEAILQRFSAPHFATALVVSLISLSLLAALWLWPGVESPSLPVKYCAALLRQKPTNCNPPPARWFIASFRCGEAREATAQLELRTGKPGAIT